MHIFQSDASKAFGISLLPFQKTDVDVSESLPLPHLSDETELQHGCPSACSACPPGLPASLAAVSLMNYKGWAVSFPLSWPLSAWRKGSRFPQTVFSPKCSLKSYVYPGNTAENTMLAPQLKQNWKFVPWWSACRSPQSNTCPLSHAEHQCGRFCLILHKNKYTQWSDFFFCLFSLLQTSFFFWDTTTTLLDPTKPGRSPAGMAPGPAEATPEG